MLYLLQHAQYRVKSILHVEHHGMLPVTVLHLTGLYTVWLNVSAHGVQSWTRRTRSVYCFATVQAEAVMLIVIMINRTTCIC